MAIVATEPLWICWTNNCRGKHTDQLYVFHAAHESATRTLCGSTIQEFGERTVSTESLPGCKRCRRIISHRKLLTPA